jgi:chemotaxis protein methyltransferase CheR
LGVNGGGAPCVVEELETELLLEALFQRFGFDFRAYERGAVSSKLRAAASSRALASLSLLQDRVLHDAVVAADVLRALSVPAAGLFDDVAQTRALRSVLGACLRASALPKVWLAECAGAEQAWSLAILLCEQGLDQRTEIHATLADESMLADVAEAGITLERMAHCQLRYAEGGGTGDLMAYFEVVDGRALLVPKLRERITWAQYNLVTDASFNEFQMIVCQRALADFGPPLRARTLRLFHDSLALFGIIGIDRALDGSDPLGQCYQPVIPGQPWYKRIA